MPLPSGSPRRGREGRPKPADRFIAPAHGTFSVLDRSGRLEDVKMSVPGQAAPEDLGSIILKPQR